MRITFKVIMVLGLFTSSIGLAKTLNCQIKINDDVLTESQVETKTKEKVFISQADSIRAYVTEKVDDIYTLEAFVGNEELRIYSEGVLPTSADRLVASLWSRNTMADIECSLRK